MSKKFQLKNGLQVLLIESHKSPVVSVQMWVKTGSADEKKGEEGISHFIEHLLFKGTRKFKVGEIASRIEGSGGELNAYTSFDQTVFYVTISKQFVETGLEAISEMMGFPAFDAAEIDNEREVVIEEIKRSIDNPHRQASRHLFSTIYRKHPYGIPVIGYDENIRSFSREMIQDYFHRRYVPENMTLLIVGDFDSAEMKKLVKAHFTAFEKRRLKKIKRAPEPAQKTPRLNVHEGKFEETLLHVAWRLPNALHKDVPALDVLALILGQGDSSRLTRALRLEKPLANYAVSSTFTPLNPGFFAISVSLDGQSLKDATETLLRELESILSAPPTGEEMTKALTNMESEEFYSLETVDGMARKFGTYEHLFGDYRYYQDFLKKTLALKPKDILTVARKYLKPDAMTLTLMTPNEVTGSEAHLREWMKQFRKVHAKATKARVPASANHVPRRKLLKWKIARGKSAPRIERIELPGGGRVLVRPSQDTPVVNVRCAFLGGLRAEPDGRDGLTDLVSRCWVSGTARLSEREIHERTESLAASLSAFGGRNTVGLTMTSLAPFSNDVFDLFTETLLAPALPGEAVEREKSLMLHQIKTRDDNPAQIAIHNFMKELFPKHPYSKQVQGEDETVQGLGRSDVTSYLNGLVNQGNFAAVIAGEVEPDRWVERLKAAYERLPKGRAFDKVFAFRPPADGRRAYAHSSKEQSHVVIGYPGLTFRDDDRYALQVIQSVLAGQGGRLFIELRDKESLAYSVSPLRMDGVDAGYFGAYIGCSPDKAQKAIGMLESEIRRLVDEKVPADELSRAKRYLIGRHDIDLQKTSSVAATVLFDEIYGVPHDEVFRFAELIAAVEADDVRRVATRLFSREPILSVVGPICPW